MLASPLAQSKDEYVNPFVDWFPEFGDLIKQKRRFRLHGWIK